MEQIRRFQLKFLVERDFYTALSVLSEANCPLTEGNATAVPHLRRLPSSSSWASSLQAPTILMTNRTIVMTPDSNAAGPTTAQWRGEVTRTCH